MAVIVTFLLIGESEGSRSVAVIFAIFNLGIGHRPRKGIDRTFRETDTQASAESPGGAELHRSEWRVTDAGCSACCEHDQPGTRDQVGEPVR
jgi:hypothetical protein